MSRKILDENRRMDKPARSPVRLWVKSTLAMIREKSDDRVTSFSPRAEVLSGLKDVLSSKSAEFFLRNSFFEKEAPFILTEAAPKHR